jgi:hypothetical protein
LNLNDLNEIPPWEWPEDAASMVLTALKDRKAIEKDRLLAAELAGDLVILNEEIADVLLDIIRSNEETAELRSSAAIALGPGLEEAELGDYSDPDDAPAFSESFLQKTHVSHIIFKPRRRDGRAPVHPGSLCQKSARLAHAGNSRCLCQRRHGLAADRSVLHAFRKRI